MEHHSDGCLPVESRSHHSLGLLWHSCHPRKGPFSTPQHSWFLPWYLLLLQANMKQNKRKTKTQKLILLFSGQILSTHFQASFNCYLLCNIVFTSIHLIKFNDRAFTVSHCFLIAGETAVRINPSVFSGLSVYTLTAGITRFLPPMKL